jgi:hypothetical protein
VAKLEGELDQRATWRAGEPPVLCGDGGGEGGHREQPPQCGIDVPLVACCEQEEVEDGHQWGVFCDAERPRLCTLAGVGQQLVVGRDQGQVEGGQQGRRFGVHVETGVRQQVQSFAQGVSRGVVVREVYLGASP